MNPDNDPKFISRRKFLSGTATVLGGMWLAACGQNNQGGTATQPSPSPDTAASPDANGATGSPAASGAEGSVDLSGAQITWSTWGNPGEIQRFQEFTADFNERTGANAQLIPVPNAEYEAKILTQLSGGTAPATFYSNDTMLSGLRSSNSIIDLTERLESDASKSRPDEFFEGLWGPARTQDGQIWGVPVDCNPLVFWYNEQVLEEAGVTTMPADLYAENQWNWEALSGMLEQVKAAGKRGLVFENWWGPIWGWATTNGGTVFTEEGQFVGHEDEQTKEGTQFILDNLNNGTFTYSGSLPQGQGMDAMFLSQQAAFIIAGRWLLPVFKQAANLRYNIVPWPTNTGEQIEPAPIATAYMVQNAAAQNADATFAFLTDFVSPDGQTFRLQGGGNAVPSVQGADEVVSEGNNPANWQALIDAREVGFAIWPGLANYPGLGNDINTTLDEVWLQGGEVDATLQRIAELVESKQGAS